MPSYKTHSIHAEQTFEKMEREVEISKEDMKTFAMGPDALIATDYTTFKNMHKENVRNYYEALLKYYKENNLLENPEAMSFLYGQLDHFMLDVVTHPLIYYLTEKAPREYRIGPHGLVEMWMDDYHMQKYGKTDKFYYHKFGIKSKELKEAIDKVTGQIYGSEDVSKAYNKGIKIFTTFDSLARNNYIGIMPLANMLSNMGDVTFKKDLERVLPYLNLDNETWINPETGEAFTTSFDDLFNKATVESEQIIHDVNNHLYHGKPLSNHFILDNTSYNTGLNCDLGQNYTYVKEYPLGKEKPNRELNPDIIKYIISLAPALLTYLLYLNNGQFDDYLLLCMGSGAAGVSFYDLVKSKREESGILKGNNQRNRNI